jgi:hypothetical protein
MRRVRNSSWEGEQWIVAQEMEGKWRAKNRDKEIVMINLILEKKKIIAGTTTTKSSVCLVKVLELLL